MDSRKTFGRLLILREFSQLDSNGHKRRYFRCQCKCGKITMPLTFSVKSGAVQSCGCYHADETRKRMKGKQRGFKHGHRLRNYESPTHKTWRSMKNRCLNENSPDYPRYGKSGVTVCERWINFQNFLTDMGIRPENRSLDRINPFGNYEPGNCRWATALEQGRNRRKTYVA